MALPTIKPTLKQYEAWQLFWDNQTMELLFGGGAGGGKTWFFCEWLLTNCYQFPGTKWFIAREELKRIMQSSYITWTKVCRYHNIPASDWKLNGQYNYIEFIDGVAKGSRIDLLEVKASPTDPMFERFGSLEYTGGFFEEAGEITFEAYDVLKSRCGRHLNQEYNILPKVGLSANPTQNWLKDRFYKQWKQGTLPKDRAFVQSLYKDNPYTADIYGKQLSNISNPTIKRRLKDGDWEYDDSSALFKRIDENIDASCLSEPIAGRQYVIGVDLARIRDFTVITVIDKHSWKLVYFERFNQIDWNLQKAKIESVSRRYNNARLKMDATGLGDPIVNDLQRVGLSIEPITLNSRVKKEIIDNLVILFEQDKLKIPNQPDLIEELKIFTYTWNDKTKNVKYTAPSGKHDDCVLSLALCMWNETKLKESAAQVSKMNVSISYDKFGRPMISK